MIVQNESDLMMAAAVTATPCTCGGNGVCLRCVLAEFEVAVAMDPPARPETVEGLCDGPANAILHLAAGRVKA